MYENKKDFSHESARRQVTELHSLDMDFCTTAMWIPTLRDTLTTHITDFVAKSSTSRGKNYSGLTHFVTGTRAIIDGELKLNSIERSANKDHKEFAKSRIDLLLSLVGMHIKAIEEAHLMDKDPTEQYAAVGSKLKHLNLHQSVRSEMYKKMENVSGAIKKLKWKANTFIRKNEPYASPSLIHILISNDLDGAPLEDYGFLGTKEDFIVLRKLLIANCHREFENLMLLVGVESIDELTKHWEIIYAASGQFQKIMDCRNQFVINNAGLVHTTIQNQMRKTLRYLDNETRQSKAENYYAQTVVMLLEKVYKYNPEHCFATFAVQYIEQECQRCLAEEDIVKLPPVYANKQADVLKAGLIKEPGGKETFDAEKALNEMRLKYPALDWDMSIIADVRFKQSTKSTISLDGSDSDEDDESNSLFHRLPSASSSPETEATNSQWAENIVGLIKSLPPMHRLKVINRFGITETILNSFTAINPREVSSMSDEDNFIITELKKIADN